MIMMLAFLIFCYLCGAIPFAYIVVRIARGIDIRTVGSGNVGATNAARILGKWGFISVFTLDMLKGLLPLLLVRSVYGESLFLLICTVAIVFGHIYTVFLNFKGGKGVATAAGVYFALAPAELWIALAVFVLVVLLTKMVSAGSVVAAGAMGIIIWIMNDWLALQIFTTIMVLFVIWKHRTNISRILNGTENKIGKKVA